MKKTKKYKLMAFATKSPFSLKPFFSHFGMAKKHHWRDYVVFTPAELTGIVSSTEGKFVHVYQFGSVVFTNFSYHESMDFVKYLDKIAPKTVALHPTIESEEYSFIIDSEVDELETSSEGITVAEHKPHTLDIIVSILAKSVAMDRIETDVDRLLDECEEILERLKVGNFKVGSKKLFKLSGEILEFKYATLSDVRVLDKPDLTWERENLDDIYTELEEKFELIERYENLNVKHETLLEIINVFTSLTQNKHGTRLEWIIIILIGLEVLLMFSH